MAWLQRRIELKRRTRGFHLITDEVLSALPELRQVRVGQLHLFLQHSSASLTLNENADPDVRRDMEGAFNRLAPENHLPVGQGELLVGIWQGLWLGEHRDHAGSRSLIATLNYE